MHGDRTLGSRLLFALSLWMSLATAIVCAIVPAGPPSTRSTGSAFDPSTTIVALRSRPPIATRLVLSRADDGDGAGSGFGGQADHVAILSAAPTPLVPAWIAVRAAVSALAVLLPRARAFDTVLYARPPPAA